MLLIKEPDICTSTGCGRTPQCIALSRVAYNVDERLSGSRQRYPRLSVMAGIAVQNRKMGHSINVWSKLLTNLVYAYRENLALV